MFKAENANNPCGCGILRETTLSNSQQVYDCVEKYEEHLSQTGYEKGCQHA